jgi:glycosyltransferase involved in cell wall biosynthesis
MIRIGIPAHGFQDWAGGVDFLFTVVDGLRAAAPGAELHLLVPHERPAGGWKRLKSTVKRMLRRGTRDRRAAPLDCSAVAALCDAVHSIPAGPDAVAETSGRLRLDAVLPSHGILPAGMPCPWVGYLYDFQHRHLPQLFTEREIRKRDEAFAGMIDAAPAVVVNSRDTAAEARSLYPHAADRIHALPFNASPRPEWLDDAADAQGPAVAGPYFIVSNQFWVHKDHATAFRAFARAAADRPDLRLVCTGQTSDYRRPEYFGTLVELLDSLGVRDRVIITGLVPKAEQIQLVKGAVAVVQPTLCEGGPGGGAVYDAVSLGIRSIISDIPINRELADEPTVSFFAVGDAESLAAGMTQALRGTPIPVAAEELRVRGRDRRTAAGRTILEVVSGLRAAG